MSRTHTLALAGLAVGASARSARADAAPIPVPDVRWNEAVAPCCAVPLFLSFAVVLSGLHLARRWRARPDDGRPSD